jgi:Neprosin
MSRYLRSPRGGGRSKRASVTDDRTVGNPIPPRGRSRTPGALVACGVIAVVSLAVVSLAVVAPGSAAASASVTRAAIATSGKVTCTKRPSIQPPPLGVLKAMPARDNTRHTTQVAASTVKIKPVCPLGEVPVIKASPRGLPKGNPDEPRGTRTGSQVPAGAGTESPAGPSCDGVIYQSEPGWCYYYGGASDTRTDQGGGHTMAIEKPVVTGAGHSLEEISVQAGTNNGNIVEIGSSVSSGDADPQLFVYHWISWSPTCYSCNFQQWSNTYYPGMDLSSLVGQQVYNGYVFYRGNWWAWFNDQWVGYFPGSLWKGQFQTSQLVQWFGEVATQNGVPPLTQMGDGLLASNLHAAPMSTLCNVNVAAWRCFYYDQQSPYQTDPQFYTVAHTGFGAIRLGGPGS